MTSLTHIQDKLDALTQQVAEATLAMEFDKAGANHVAPSDVSISTLSIIVTCYVKTLGASAVCATNRGALEAFMAARFDLPSVRRAVERLLGTPKFGLITTKFRNSITLEYKDPLSCDTNKKSAKIFLPSCRMQIAGIKSYAEIPRVISSVVSVLHVLLDSCPEEAAIQPVDVKVSFAQAVMNLHMGVYTHHLHDLMMKDRAYSHVTLAMSHYVQGRISIKKPESYTLLLFATGKAIVTGFRTPAQMAEAYAFLVSVVDALYDDVHDTVPRRVKPPSTGKRGRKRKTDTLEAFLLAPN